MVKVTVLFDDVQRVQIDHVRGRAGPIAEDVFWRVVIGDGLGLFLFQIEEDEAGTAEANERVNTISWALPDEPGPVTAIEVDTSEEVAEALVILRARRPGWSEAKFWQQVLEWGTSMLPQVLDREDRPDEGGSGKAADDDLPF